MVTKKGHLDKWQFYKNDKFGKHLWKFGKNFKQDDKRGMSIIVGFMKMTFCEIGEFGIKDSLHVKSGENFQWYNKRGILTVGDFREIGKFEKNGKLGKNPSKVWQNLNWGDQEESLDKSPL